MDKGDVAVLMIVSVIAGAALTAGIMTNNTRGGVWIPCGIAEISPDVPPKYKEYCRIKQLEIIRK